MMTAKSEASDIAKPRTLALWLWGASAVIMAVLYTVILSSVAAIVAPFRDGHWVSPVSQLWGWLIIRICGVKIEIEGLEHLRGIEPFVMVANHQSMFDIFAIVGFIPGETRFVAKKELLKVPMLGYAMRRSGHILVDRRRGGQAIRRAIEVSRLGYNICVFAEGTRFSDNRVHDFNDGAAWIALATHRRCIPVAISGSAAVFPRGARLVVPRRRILIRLCAPIETRSLKSSDRDALTHQLETAVRSAFVSQV
ncbi:MAG: 1-acyl-sn-glycerol-3-phosphate acyltransferase [Candidatus Binataceae bacterium]|nr:1-acyl-sn-glycerol-3-phosphate acyltransferase [Candidatus Binataceae bacterium]